MQQNQAYISSLVHCCWTYARLFSNLGWWFLRIVHAMYSRHIMLMTATLLSGDRSCAKHYLPRSVARFADPKRLAAMVAAQGFDVQQPVPMTMGICARSHRQFAGRRATSDYGRSSGVTSKASTKNDHVSATSSIRIDVGLPAPCPALRSMRIRTGFPPAACAC